MVRSIAFPYLASGCWKDHMLTLRDHHFAAVAADNTSVELRPTMASWNIHDYLLPMWGTPVGELFDLEPLSQLCQKLGRYSFFVTSAPLNVMGGIACISFNLRY